MVLAAERRLSQLRLGTEGYDRLEEANSVQGGARAVETAAPWKRWKNRRRFSPRSHRAWKTLRLKRSEFPTVPTASAAGDKNIFLKAVNIVR